MKKALSIMCIIMMLLVSKLFAYDFSAAHNGQTIYYNITSSTAPLTVEVTYYEHGISTNYSGSVDIPSIVTNGNATYSVTAIGNSAFFHCSDLTSVTIPNSVTSIGYNAFHSCSGLISITIPNLVTTIRSYTFADCSELISITIPDSVTTIENHAFEYCSALTSVTFPNSLATIGERAFAFCSELTSVIIPDLVTTIGEMAFFGCSSLISATLSNSLTTIGGSAFYSCNSLTSITIPYSVTTIGGWVFAYCSELTEIYVKAQTPPTLGYAVFQGVPDTIPVHVPCGTISAYQSAWGWTYFNNIMDDILFDVIVESNDVAMGTAHITQVNTCTDNTAIIEALPNQGYRFVEWNDGDANNPRTITVTQDITYTAIFETETGIPVVETGDALSLQIYPNPTSNQLRIKNYELREGDRIEFYNMLGRRHSQLSIFNSQFSTLDVSHLPNGVYLLHIVSDNRVICEEKVVIAR
jgi:hypothetical protein